VYTITFYSFKGGVGRTLALVNFAAQLARMGRKVLLVDFDLEAPGLETFDRLRPPAYHRLKVKHSKHGEVTVTMRETHTLTHPGMVEYVTEYMRTKSAPDVRGYAYSAGQVGKKGGQLWVMPAGRRDAQYQSALAIIDWLALYREHDGFILFEDTKAQWEQEFKPDYVLIDSRTGHTDVEGICTRQLPDAVVVFFFPNEQNLVGLQEVCRRIRAEASSGLMKQIRLHFVMSNVPDLDDEEGILRRCLEEFDWELEFGGRPDAVIHRCESAMLFNQAIFVLDRPKSRLAREYKRLVWNLIAHNPADRDGALRFLIEYFQYLTELSHAIMDRRTDTVAVDSG
jgi:MinD-like ATPase involved in chromosome partitioning or flagellar assembly